MTAFDKTFATVEIEAQKKANVRNAKKAYIADLVAQGVDKETAKVMAKTFFEYGLLNAM